MTTHAPAAPDRAPAPPARSRALALAVLCAGMLMIILDGSIVTVALPAIQDDLHFSPADLTWTVNAYLIAFGGLLLLAGRLGDLIGRKRVFVAGLALFTAASLLCALATSQAMLIAARFLQGVGGALASAVSLGMIVTLFPESGERGRAIGAFSFVGAAGASIGQVLGGVLTQALDWHWIFLINLPIGLAAALLAVRVLAPDRGPGLRAGVDGLGAALITAALMLGIYTIVGTGEHGWASARTSLLGALALALLAAFTLRQARAARPLLPLRIFRSRGLAGAAAVQALMVGGMFGFQVMIALYLQNVRGYGAAATGLAMLPAALTGGAVSLLLSARLNVRFGERRMLLTGLGLLLAGLTLLTRLPADADYVLDVLPTMLLISGFGLAISALTALAMAGVDPRDAGTASGLFGTAQQVGGALGVAVLSALATGRAHALADAGRPVAESLTAGFRLAFTVAAGLLALALLLASVLVRPAVRT
ncbi:DHA2 family efflux MFS transporter permease subunit [Streptomyces sp. CBMA123]|uniref:DHA2 family efflux MFS transporter permease subunit n=1 Tax=Streptomyces sp. CBMA123 TaxID=1896313 RepID=UPI0016620A2F|nr:DHA2 family efflux MFS transporter permease subunit [Streptomyces sp. CBMA123]MBD0695766.1 MFS transporter [Streptomyces sp. CBMA123]